jgi:predicted HicB family RNase H-like nuclease
MRHKGYSAAIRYSEEDGFLVGRILGINDIVSFHGHSVEEVRKEFAIALDSYLSDCEEMGKEPERSYSGKLNLRLSPEFHKAIAIEAETTGQSLNDVIVAALQQTYVDVGGGRKRRNVAVKPAAKGKRSTRRARAVVGVGVTKQ